MAKEFCDVIQSISSASYPIRLAFVVFASLRVKALQDIFHRSVDVLDTKRVRVAPPGSYFGVK